MCKIKIAILDDDIDWIESIKLYLNSCEDISIVGTAVNRQDLIELLQERKDIDIVLLDIILNQNKYDGIYIAAEILHLYENLKIIMLTCLNEEKSIIDSFTAGAINYVLKTDYKQIPYTIRTVFNRCCPTEILAKSFAKQQEEKMLDILTKSEREIINLIQQGYTQSKIAKILYKSQGTLRCQINKIIKKFGVSSSKEAVEKITMRGFYKNKS